MLNRDFYFWLKDLASYEAFKNCVSLSERLIDEQYDLELVLRFFAYKNSTREQIREAKDIGDFVTNRMKSFCANPSNFDLREEKRIFELTFDLLYEIFEDQVFKRYDNTKDKFLGAFSICAYEVIATGLGKNIDRWQNVQNRNNTIASKVKSIWNDTEFRNRSGSGTTATGRIPFLLPYGENLFRP